MFFFIFMVLQNANRNAFHGFGNLVIWFWKSFEKIFNGFCTKPDSIAEVNTIILYNAIRLS